MAECIFKRGESLLSTSQIPGLEGLSDGGEILLALGVAERFGIGKRTVLPEGGQGSVGGLSGGQVAGLKGLS